MVPVGRSTDLTHEARPTDSILVKGDGREQVAFKVWGASVEVLSEVAVSRGRVTATDKISSALAVLIDSATFIAAFALSAHTARTVGATTPVALGTGLAAVALVLLLIIVTPRHRGRPLTRRNTHDREADARGAEADTASGDPG